MPSRVPRGRPERLLWLIRAPHWLDDAMRRRFHRTDSCRFRRRDVAG
jgi:hypothetical protein